MRRSLIRNTKRALLATALVGALIALPAASQQGKVPKTQLWMDVATHTMSGVPGMSEMGGGVGGMAMRMFGGDAAQNHYGAAQTPGMPGRYVDVALLNQLNPGAEAEDLIPAGLQLGKSLPLLPPKAPEASTPGGKPNYQPADGNAKARILIYWGCGTEVRAGQPREIKFEMNDGKVTTSGTQYANAMSGRYAPNRDAKVDPRYALWPNEKMRKMVPQNGSLVGNHDIEGAKVPASMKFDLTQQQDFMPAIALSSSGSLATGQTWNWKPVDRANGYFLAAFGQQDDAVVIWSSSEVPDAGMNIIDYVTPSTVNQWINEKVVLAPSVTSCAIPNGIFAGQNGQPGAGMLSMIAYGPETNILYPPKPSDAKALAAWHPEWNVRVRNKSTTMAMLGMNIDANSAQQDASQPNQPQESKGKKFLKGLLGR